MNFLQKLTRKPLPKLLVLLLSLTLYQQSLAANAAAQLVKLLKTTKTLQSDFTQTIYDDQGHKLQESRGKLMIVKPNRFRWQIETPMPQLLVSDGKTLWNYQALLKQAIEQPVQKGIQATPLAILSGDAGIFRTHYFVTKSNANTYHLNARKKGNFKTIILVFNGDKIRQMRLYDNVGQSTALHFINLQRNKKIAARYFSVQLPKGVDIIRNQ